MHIWNGLVPNNRNEEWPVLTWSSAHILDQLPSLSCFTRLATVSRWWGVRHWQRLVIVQWSAVPCTFALKKQKSPKQNKKVPHTGPSLKKKEKKSDPLHQTQRNLFEWTCLWKLIKNMSTWWSNKTDAKTAAYWLRIIKLNVCVSECTMYSKYALLKKK